MADHYPGQFCVKRKKYCYCWHDQKKEKQDNSRNIILVLIKCLLMTLTGNKHLPLPSGCTRPPSSATGLICHKLFHKCVTEFVQSDPFLSLQLEKPIARRERGDQGGMLTQIHLLLFNPRCQSWLSWQYHDQTIAVLSKNRTKLQSIVKFYEMMRNFYLQIDPGFTSDDTLTIYIFREGFKVRKKKVWKIPH